MIKISVFLFGVFAAVLTVSCNSGSQISSLAAINPSAPYTSCTASANSATLWQNNCPNGNVCAVVNANESATLGVCLDATGDTGSLCTPDTGTTGLSRGTCNTGNFCFQSYSPSANLGNGYECIADRGGAVGDACAVANHSSEDKPQSGTCANGYCVNALGGGSYTGYICVAEKDTLTGQACTGGKIDAALQGTCIKGDYCARAYDGWSASSGYRCIASNKGLVGDVCTGTVPRRPQQATCAVGNLCVPGYSSEPGVVNSGQICVSGNGGIGDTCGAGSTGEQGTCAANTICLYDESNKSQPQPVCMAKTGQLDEKCSGFGERGTCVNRLYCVRKGLDSPRCQAKP